MAHHDHIIELEPGDAIAVRDRPHRPGCALELSKGNITYLSPDQENQLLHMLLSRAPRSDLGRAMGLPLGFDVGLCDPAAYRSLRPSAGAKLHRVVGFVEALNDLEPAGSVS